MRLKIKQFIYWKIIYNPVWKIVYKGYYTYLWDIPKLLHLRKWGQTGDNGLLVKHNCKYGWKHMTILERSAREENLSLEGIEYNKWL